MEIIKLNSNDLLNQDKTMLTKVIYNNFPELVDVPNVVHTEESIKKTLESKNVVLIIALTENKKIGGYLLGDIMILEDGRKVLFISYLYVANSLRNKGLGKKIMFESFTIGNNEFCDGVLLIYDTTDKQLREFYGKLGFMLDFNLRRYEKNDVFYKVLY